MHQQLGAHEVMEVHEVLTNIIDGINTFKLYRPQVNDQQLSQIIDRQINYMEHEYQNMVSIMSQHRGVAVDPYRSRINTEIRYGLRNPSPISPNERTTSLSDRDVASATLGFLKLSSTLKMNAALECADPQVRRMVVQSAVSCAEMAYEMFCFMNSRGMYQVPTMPMRTENNFIGAYQTGNLGGITGFHGVNPLS